MQVDTLRAWERRYGLLEPSRSSGGFRLYTPRDEQRVREMKALIDSGVSAAQAARLAAGRSAAPTSGERTRVADANLADMQAQLIATLEGFDEAGANAILDEALTRLTVDAAAGRVVLPAMREIGERWESGEISVAQEHFATGVLRGRMLGLARNWGAGNGPLALLACPPGERHDLGLLAFGVVLRDRGWRITYLGPDTPIETIERTAVTLGPAAIVLAALSAGPFEAVAEQVASLAESARVLIGGEGASPALADRLGVEALDLEPVDAALQLAG